MKKLAIAGASLALAAMPVVSSFAAVTDTITLTIQSSCSVGGAEGATSTTGKTITEANAVNNHLYTYAADGSVGGTLKVTCNKASGWQVKAQGAGTGTPVTSMAASGSGTPIITGTATSGPTSNWAFKVASSDANISVPTTYASFAAVPAEATTVASGSASIAEGTIYTGYQVWVSATQQADTYTGRVTYTVVENS